MYSLFGALSESGIFSHFSVKMVFRGRLKMAKMGLSEVNFQLIFYFKLVSIQNYRHQSKELFWDFHTKHSHSFYGVSDFMPRPLFMRGLGTWPRPFFSKARGATAQLRTPQEHVLARGARAKNDPFFSATCPK